MELHCSWSGFSVFSWTKRGEMISRQAFGEAQGVRGMDQDLNLTPRTCLKRRHSDTCLQFQFSGGRHRRMPGPCWQSVYLNLWVPSSVRDPISNSMWKVIENDSWCWLLTSTLSHTDMNMYTHIYTWNFQGSPLGPTKKKPPNTRDLRPSR